MWRVRAVSGLGLILAVSLPTSAADPDPYDGIRLKNKALVRLLKRQSSGNDALIEALGAVEREYFALPLEADLSDSAQVKRLDKLKDTIEKSWIRALTVVKTPPRTKVNVRARVQIRAAQTIARSRPCIDARFRRALERKILDNDKYVCEPALYRAAFAALVTLNQPKLVEWFLDHGVKSQVDPDHQARTLAAFHALTSMRNVPGVERREVVRKILAIFQSYAFHWLNEYDAVAGFRTVKKVYAKVAGVATPYWMDIRPTVLETLRHFSTDPRTGLPPFDKRTGREIEALPRYLNWFASHQRPAQAPWRDPKPDAKPPKRKRAAGRYVRPTIPLLFHEYGIPWEFWRSVARDPLRPRTMESTGQSETSASDAFRALLRKRLHKSLRPFLEDEEPHVRAATAVALASTGAPDAVEQLVALVESDEQPVVREAAMLGLMLLHPKDRVAWFQARVRDVTESVRARGYAALALGWLKESTFLWELVRADSHKSLGGEAAYADLRACAVFALGLAGETDAAEPLAKLLSSPSECVAVLAAIGPALAQLEEASVIPALLRVLVDRRKIETRHVAQVSAAAALGRLVAPDDHKCIRAIQQRVARSSERFGGVRSQLALSLGRIGGQTAFQVLEDAYQRCLKSTTRVAERGFFLLGFAMLDSAGGRHRIRTQHTELTHDKDLGALAAAVTLGDDRSALPRVAGRLDGTGPNYAPYAIAAMGRLGTLPSAEDVRTALVRRHDPRVVRAGALALARLLGPAALVDVKAIWERSHLPVTYDTLAWAFHHMPCAEAETWLHAVVKQEYRRPCERAFAVLALSRMAGGATVSLPAVFTQQFNPYGEAATLSCLALRRDAAFLE